MAKQRGPARARKSQGKQGKLQSPGARARVRRMFKFENRGPAG